MCRSPSTGGTGQNPARGSVAGAGWRGITGQRAGAVTDAPRASCAVWRRTLRWSPPEQARLRENGETTFARWIGGQSGRTTGEAGDLTGGAPGAPNDKMSSNRGCRGHPRRGCCEREPESDRVSICPEAGSFPQARCDFGSFPLTNRYTSPGEDLTNRYTSPEKDLTNRYTSRRASINTSS